MSIGCRVSYHKVTNAQNNHHQYRTIVVNGDFACDGRESFADFTVWSDEVTFKLKSNAN
jgi:hypothetical protein